MKTSLFILLALLLVSFVFAQTETDGESPVTDGESPETDGESPETDGESPETDGESTPSADSTPSEDSTPSADSTPSEDSTPSADSTPSEDSTPSADSTPSEDSTPSPDTEVFISEDEVPDDVVDEVEDDAALVVVEGTTTGKAILNTEALEDDIENDIANVLGIPVSSVNVLEVITNGNTFTAYVELFDSSVASAEQAALELEQLESENSALLNGTTLQNATVLIVDDGSDSRSSGRSSGNSSGDSSSASILTVFSVAFAAVVVAI